MTTRALVLGGGGVTGIGWEAGLIAGLAGESVALAAADDIIGTSAGLRLTAVDAHSGERVVFDSAGPASLVDAVAASGAVPGQWPPVTIGDNARIPSPRGQAAALAAAGARVVVVKPEGPAARATRNRLDPSRRAAAARAGLAQAPTAAAAVRAVWQER